MDLIKNEDYQVQNRTARIAGLVYLCVVLTGIFNLVYVPSKLIVWDDAAITFNNITTSEMLFRMGILSGLISYVCYIMLPIVLYKLLKPVHKEYAIVMVVFAIISVPISYLNIQNKVDVLSLIGNAEYLKVYTGEQLQAQVMLLLESYHNGILIVEVFWGLWLFPFGYLVFKSGFLPKVLGILLMMGCFSYLITVCAGLLFPHYKIPSFVMLPASIGEIGSCLWLLIMGTKKIINIHS
ncbi:hypothetical protein ATO12_19955 [Aquimarina atlantica]|uniref:DUF4386 domain-containing protein n=1 Tax=Aquimarina atlantica TaxID=1317122 RepID=A0A023BU03_9FLAO|nr:DUF4386 domain-containing protein [Aquimarina atlantica]EZH73278.1 hypothetical protein ATO12_19955 [Aquimarina atlantica]